MVPLIIIDSVLTNVFPAFYVEGMETWHLQQLRGLSYFGETLLVDR